ncbi:MAG: cytochrome b5 domain-containing protein [Candidatus Moranbacteria bacterium]|nr:cytochrome b5 domain-containing protein [Candidatus Moranbacteria bacterium]
MKKILSLALIFLFSLTLSGCFLAEEKEAIPPQAMKIIEPSSPTDKVDLPTYTLQEVASHNTAQDCWLIVGSDIIDATSFFGKHPGGDTNLLKGCGKDATEMFISVKKHDPAGYAKAKELTIGLFVEDAMEMIDTPKSTEEGVFSEEEEE